MIMRRAAGLAGLILIAIAIGLPGCGPKITGVNAAPNINSATDREGMIKWHQQHDKKAGNATPAGQ